MRERGLKPAMIYHSKAFFAVAPHAGAWIETSPISPTDCPDIVAPHAGAWIETALGLAACRFRSSSLPMRERGLKQMMNTRFYLRIRRSPCGSVD